jgi:hypothetical protein
VEEQRPAGPLCQSCGAPCNPGLVACSYCEAPFPGAPTGVNCPACGDDNRPHLSACATCNHSLTQSCLFCNGVSSIVISYCYHCREPFEGAEARMKQREEQARQQQMMGLASQGISTIGSVAQSPTGRAILGAVWNELIKK